MAAHLGALGVGADIVGVMHHPGREPQHPALDALQRRERLGVEPPSFPAQFTLIVTTADIPARSGCGFPNSLTLSRILTGTRWTTLTQLPVAFSGGRSEKREPVPG